MSGPGRPGLLAVGELRLLLVWRRLRGRGGTGELVGKALLFAVALPLSLVFAGLLGAASYRAARAGGGLRLDVPVTALFFGLWQAWTAVALSVAERDTVDLSRLLRYPVSPGRVYVLGLASGVLGDPFAAFWLVLLGGALAGAALGRFGAWLVPLALVLAAFAAATVALVALVQEVFARLARRRFFREVAIVAGIVGWGLFLAAVRLPTQPVWAVLRRLQWVLFPPGLAAAAARQLYAGRIAPALPPLALLLAAAGLCGMLAYRLALATALSGGEEGRAGSGAAERAPRFLPERLGPLFEKELRYAFRHPATRVSLLVAPALSALVAWRLAPAIPAEAGELVKALPLFAIAAYVHLALQAFWLNAFGWDRGGARALFLAPIRPASILAAKNGATALAAAALFSVSAVAYLGVGGAPPAWTLAAAALLHAGLAPFFLSLGNLASILNPRAAPFAMQRSGSLPALSAVAGMAIASGATAAFGLPVLLALRLESPALLVGCWGLLAAAGWTAWWRTLPRAGALLERRREAVLAEVCGDGS